MHEWIVGIVGTVLLLVLILPDASLVVRIVDLGAFVGFAAAVVWAMTFWRKARVQIGRLELRYKAVRRNAGVVAVIGLSLLVVQGVALGVRNSLQQSRVAGGSPTPEASPAIAGASPAAKVSRDAELERARKSFCVWSEYYSSMGKLATDEQRSLSAGAAQVDVQEFFHSSYEEAVGVADEVEKDAVAARLDCAEFLKRNPLKAAWPTYQPGDHTEASRAAAIFCREMYSLLKPSETVEDAESTFSSQPCNVDGNLRNCPNGTRFGPTNAIAEKFTIPWQQANADIVAGLATFDPKSPIADACSQLGRQYPADAAPGPEDWIAETELLRGFCAELPNPSVSILDFLNRATDVENSLRYHRKVSPDETMLQFCRRYESEPEFESFCARIERDPKAGSFTPEGYAKDLVRLTNVISHRASDYRTTTLADVCRSAGF